MFKVGDRVECVIGIDNLVPPGSIGTIIRVVKDLRNVYHVTWDDVSTTAMYIYEIKLLEEKKVLKEFEIGKYYRWVGPQNYHTNWNSNMEAWKDGVPRRCTDKHVCWPDMVRYTFDGIGRISSEYYYEHCMEYFEEVDMKGKEGLRESIAKMEKELESMKEQLNKPEKIIFNKNKYYVIERESGDKHMLIYMYEFKKYMFMSSTGIGWNGTDKNPNVLINRLDDNIKLHVFDCRARALEFFNKKG